MVNCRNMCNGSYGQMKFKNSPLYDPRNANNVCVHGQIIALYLVSKLETVGQILNTNTDGVLVKVHSVDDIEKVERICEEVAKTVRIGIDIEQFRRFVVKDVNNYIAIKTNGKVKAVGGYVKYLNPLEQSLSIINTAIREYYINGVSAEKTIMESDNIFDFQIIAKAGRKYSHVLHGTTFKEETIMDKNGKKKKIKVVDKQGNVLNEKCNRVFASTNPKDGGIFKIKVENGAVAKIEMTPESCFVINEDIRGWSLPNNLDKQWYISLANRRIKEFIGLKG